MENVEQFKKNFEDIYYTKILEMAEPFEKKRMKTLLMCIAFLLTGVFLMVLTFWAFDKTAVFFPFLSKEIAEYVMIIPFFFGLASIVYASHLNKEFERNIKKAIMPVILKSLVTFQWKQNTCIPDPFIRKSELFGSYNSRENDDMFQGVYKNVQINISETELGEHKGHGKNRTYTVRFKGVLVSLFPEKNYKGTTLIKKKSIFNTKPAGYEEVILEDVDFAKQFKVFSNDQIEARYVLTTAFMDRFKKLCFAFNASKIEASIKPKGILMGLSTNKDLFKVGKLHRPVCDYKQFKKMVDEFASILDLIDELKLYQNIGL